MTPIPIIKGSVQQLSLEARDLLAEVGITLRRTSKVKVILTQVAEVGVSFQFVSTPTFKAPDKEFHVPIRMVPQIFC